jgi:hypothetical protein
LRNYIPACRYRVFIGKWLDDQFERIGREDGIGIDNNGNVGINGIKPVFLCRPLLPGVFRCFYYPCSGSPGDLSGVVGRAVVDDKYFLERVRLLPDTPDRITNRCLFVVCRDDHGYPGKKRCCRLFLLNTEKPSQKSITHGAFNSKLQYILILYIATLI